MLRFPLIYAQLPLLALVKKQREQKPTWWTMCMTWVLIFIFTWVTDGFGSFFSISGNFLRGDLVARAHGSSASTIAAGVVVLVPIMIAILPIIQKQVADQTDDSFRTKSPQRLFAMIMTTLLVEELFARLLFLGLMTRIPGLGGTLFFYLFSLSGNILWSLLHLRNFTNKRDRKLIMVLPQFIQGLCFTMIYVSHGFFAALMVHVIYDMVLLCTDCRTLFRPSRLLLSLYHLVFLGISAFLFFGMRNRSLLDIGSLEDSAPNWTSADYLYLVSLLTAGISLLLEMLRYDLERAKNGKEFLSNLGCFGFFLVLTYPVILLMDVFFPGNFVIQVIGVSILITFLEKTISGSGVARLFWKSLLITSMVVMVVQVTDQGTALLLLLPYLLHQLGERAIMLSYSSWFSLKRLDLVLMTAYGAFRDLPFNRAIYVVNTCIIASEMEYRSKSLK